MDLLDTLYEIEEVEYNLTDNHDDIEMDNHDDLIDSNINQNNNSHSIQHLYGILDQTKHKCYCDKRLTKDKTIIYYPNMDIQNFWQKII